ncbi:MAG: undecaprenyldiphospho-muramoylpentapeptide beta-N-acetylglucosaminyltransferase [Acidobacteria bacterium]|nr:undecaprenyldiphospho-muramoylpentapeptide beta-N-acetylglucosaminyltransferase [Acidobacteriota bacterium]
MAGKCFLMAGGGTGGHVMPLLAVAEQLRTRGQSPYFIGTKTGFEARLVPERKFPIEYIEIGGFVGLGLARKLKLLYQLPLAILKCLGSIRKNKPVACFSLGGYAAAPPVVASLLSGLPLIVMEPNAMPGVVNRWMGRFAYKALLSFPQAASYFPARAVEITGLPVREEFFAIEAKPFTGELTLLITGGSQGSQTLNNAVRELWPLLHGLNVRLIHQCGRSQEEQLRQDFTQTCLKGEVKAFIEDMPAAYQAADLVLSRAGAGTVSELAAAGRPAILVPFPFAADDHQAKNAQAVVDAGAGFMFRDSELTGKAILDIITNFNQHPDQLAAMSARAHALRQPGAAARAADILLKLDKT